MFLLLLHESFLFSYFHVIVVVVVVVSLVFRLLTFLVACCNDFDNTKKYRKERKVKTEVTNVTKEAYKRHWKMQKCIGIMRTMK